MTKIRAFWSGWAASRRASCTAASTDYVGPRRQPRRQRRGGRPDRAGARRKPDDPLYVVAIGAISNVASALLAAPDIIDRIVVVWLGRPAARAGPTPREFNLWQDVGGAQMLFDSGA